jgi:fibronectin type 3 domain-containing protein
MDGSAANDLTFPYALGETHFSRAHRDVFTSSYRATANGPGSGDVLLRLTPDGRLDADFAIIDRSNTEYRNFSRGGHAQSSPDETMFARASGAVHLPDGTARQVILPDLLGGGDYVSWRVTPAWFLLETFSEVDKVWADGSNVQRLCFPNSANSTYYSLPWSCSSPDGTKLAFRSTMTGNVELYQAVVSKPLPPVAVSAQARPDGVTLSWEAPALHREIAGYHAYRSRESGRGFVQVTPEPVSATSFTDTTAVRGNTHYYVLTSVEHSGLESAWSAEVSATPPSGAKWTGPIRHFYEAEFAAFTPPLVQRRDPLGASNLHHVSASDYLADRLTQRGEAAFGLNVPLSKTYRLLVRARAKAGTEGALAALTMEGRPVGECKVASADWEWVVAADRLQLTRGRRRLGWSPADSAFELDCLCLTDDPRYAPTGRGPGDQEPPAEVAGLTATETAEYEVALKWDAATDPDVSHYNVYASRSPGFTPSQATRVGSQYRPAFLDWGLKPGTTYAYRVAAVDRAGNEGAASAEVTATTQPLTVGQVVIEAETAQLAGEAMVHDEPEASGGKATWVPELGTTGEYPNLVRGKATGDLAAEFLVPLDARYRIWARMRCLWPHAAVGLFIDGRRVGNTPWEMPWEVDFGYYHEKGYMIWGPRAATSYVYCWCPARTNTCPDPRPFLVELGKGTHRLELRGIGEGLSIDQVVLTNDLSWRPEPGPLNYY